MSLHQKFSFSKEKPWLQFAWDSSSLSCYLRCPRRYFYQYICGYRPHAESVDLRFGTLVHLAMEEYHLRRLESGHDEAQRCGLRSLLAGAWERDENERSGTVGMGTAVAGEGLVPDRDQQGSVEGAPGETAGGAADAAAPGNSGHYWRSSSNNKNLWNALRAFIWHTEQFGFEPDFYTAQIGRKITAVELPFHFGLGFRVAGLEALYCGHLDRVVDTGSGRWVVDYKTTKKTLNADYFGTYMPSTQLPGYAVAAKIVFHEPVQGVIIDAFQVGVDFTRCARSHILLGAERADEWLENAQDWTFGAMLTADNAEVEVCSNITDFATKNAKNWKMNTESCFICPFKEVCASTPSVRGHILEAGFKLQHWDPLDRQHKEKVA